MKVSLLNSANETALIEEGYVSLVDNPSATKAYVKADGYSLYAFDDIRKVDLDVGLVKACHNLGLEDEEIVERLGLTPVRPKKAKDNWVPPPVNLAKAIVKMGKAKAREKLFMFDRTIINIKTSDSEHMLILL